MMHPLSQLAEEAAGRIASRLSDARVTARMSGSHSMRDLIAEELRAYNLALLRHPAMREPSAQQKASACSRCPPDVECERRVVFEASWRAGLDALAREVESSR